MCIDYRKLNQATKNDYFSLPFKDEILERLNGRLYYCFLDECSASISVPIAYWNREKTTFAYPFGTYPFNKMFLVHVVLLVCFKGACKYFFECYDANYESFHGLTVHGNSFDDCIHHLTLVRKHCSKTNLVLNFKKCYFILDYRVVLGHPMSSIGD